MKQSAKRLLTTAGMISASIIAGLTLSANETKAATQVSGENKVTVEAGDTYKSIAESNGVTIAELEQANGREVGGFDLIFPGETVTIPVASTNNQVTNANSNNEATATTTDGTQVADMNNNNAQQETTSTQSASQATSYANDYSGTQLSRSAGTIQGPSGKETYYNLPMNQVIANAQAQGIQGSYWVRADGVKMYGNNVIVAAHRGVHPQGSTVQTSLGTGIVLDTGSFAYGNANQLDIATAW